ADDESKSSVLRALLEQASPISDVRGSREYREAMLLVMSRRALLSSIERLGAA
ncbi:MAG: xanthine dehydrogenase family protein subunit M, partial [Chloroflexi bacterium]